MADLTQEQIDSIIADNDGVYRNTPFEHFSYHVTPTQPKHAYHWGIGETAIIARHWEFLQWCNVKRWSIEPFQHSPRGVVRKWQVQFNNRWNADTGVWEASHSNVHNPVDEDCRPWQEINDPIVFENMIYGNGGPEHSNYPGDEGLLWNIQNIWGPVLLGEDLTDCTKIKVTFIKDTFLIQSPTATHNFITPHLTPRITAYLLINTTSDMIWELKEAGTDSPVSRFMMSKYGDGFAFSPKIGNPQFRYFVTEDANQLADFDIDAGTPNIIPGTSELIRFDFY